MHNVNARRRPIIGDMAADTPHDSPCRCMLCSEREIPHFILSCPGANDRCDCSAGPLCQKSDRNLSEKRYGAAAAAALLLL